LEQNVTNDQNYSPVEICQIFEISKSTLLRWEREGLLGEIKRDIRTGEREYSKTDIQIIYGRLVEQLGQQYARSLESDNIEAVLRIHEKAALQRFIQGEVFIGLQTLEALEYLSSEGVLQLLQEAKEKYTPEDPVFSQILKVAYNQSLKLSVEGHAPQR
jgi:DNA-binding transcriptional MerR regulator